MKVILVLLTVFIVLTTFFLTRNQNINLKNPILLITQPPQLSTKDLLLPDLFIDTPRNIRITGSGSTRKLRFTSSYGNLGQGPLEMIGRSDPDKKVTYATQNILKTDGTSISRDVGQFVFHPGHNHWHIDNYTQYQIWSIKDAKADKLVASTAKQSVCLWDEKSFDTKLPGAPSKGVFKYPCEREKQGFSVGWGDVYASDIPGQEISLSGVVNGTYILRNTVNPDNKIYEMNTDNNTGETVITISGARVSVKK